MPSSMEAMVVYEDVSKFFPMRAQSGREHRPELMVALDRVNATIRKGEFITLFRQSAVRGLRTLSLQSRSSPKHSLN